MELTGTHFSLPGVFCGVVLVDSMEGIQRRGLEMFTFAPEEMLFFHSETHSSLSIKEEYLGFPGGAVVGNLPANAGDTGSRPGLGSSHMPWSN